MLDRQPEPMTNVSCAQKGKDRMSRKNKMHEVRMPDPSKKNFVGTISMRDIEARVRKPLPPASRFHRNKTVYTRKQKHSGENG